MKDTGKTKAQLILELDYLRQKVAQLETGKTERKQAEAELKLRLELLDSATGFNLCT